MDVKFGIMSHGRDILQEMRERRRALGARFAGILPRSAKQRNK